MKFPACVLLLLASLLYGPNSQAQKDWCKSNRLQPGVGAQARLTQQAATQHGLAVFYVLPSDIPYEVSVHQRLIEATQDIQGWYQCASGGVTWKLTFPEVVRVYHADQTREFYRTHGDWWGSLLGEIGSKGLPIWSPGTVTVLWTRGPGFWAGAAQGCGVDCGVALLGVEIFPEFNRSEWSGGNCPPGVGVAAFPCTPEGAFAHELGHTVGLPHPFDFPATHDDAFHSIMQTHWNYPNFASGSESPWGFLTLERQVLRANPFMQRDISLFQIHPGCDVVNLPSVGAAPNAGFDLNVLGLTASATNTSDSGSLYYWTFGDGAESNATNPTHTYGRSATFPVALRASSDASATDLARSAVNLGPCPSFIVRGKTSLGPLANDDRFRLLSTFVLGRNSNGIRPVAENVTLWVGVFNTTFPPGSFQQIRGREYKFSGTLNGVVLKATIRPLGKKQFAFRIEAQGAELFNPQRPIAVGLTIGDDSWCGSL